MNQYEIECKTHQQNIPEESRIIKSFNVNSCLNKNKAITVCDKYGIPRTNCYYSDYTEYEKLCTMKDKDKDIWYFVDEKGDYEFDFNFGMTGTDPKEPSYLIYINTKNIDVPILTSNNKKYIRNTR